MPNLYGIWIDHSHALIAKTDAKGDLVTVTKVESDVESHHHSGIESAEHLTITNQHAHNERRKNQMHAFCGEILGHIRDADEIAVFGPSNAKNEFKNELGKNKALAKKFITMETVDKLTENQFVAYTKKLFGLPRL